ncbi:MAG: N-6 DNA methylase [Phenylobacterium sp.]|uniref:class I SAM-dependent DNA methyltransferase n=1 Tax=Phenylobacterium sp. TaxID=1871053 RepID=UPI0027346092|nr:DNA methyltransferase [Phenylobacterium sp.]MDP3175060.1 N-6 DNA methylase [Phenylobacterium sp.]
MNAVEIEEAVSALARQPFDADEFPYAFLQAFGRKDVELKRLRKNNTSDVAGGVLRRDSIHMAVVARGEAGVALTALRESPKSAANRVKFLFATDGDEVQAEETATGDFRSFPLTELDRHFGFFLPLAGISAVRQIKDNPIDVRAVGRLNKLYLELLRENPDWEEEAKRPELNRLMARLVFCFFAEDTGIFMGESLFTSTVRQFSEDRSGVTNTDQVLAQLFLAMATPTQHDGRPDGRYRQSAGVKGYADAFPYVNGGLFSDAGEVPRFTRAARNYLLHAGELDWKEINPDIFGSMIQAVADDAERGSLGMHYTSVPNILKVLNPLFLDGLNEALAEAGDSVRKLRALRRRIGRIRVFDPACGSGNFLVIAYRQMRDIEHEIIKLTGDDPKSVIPLTNFYGIEIKGFAAEIARLAMLIAEFQADARLISQQAARSMVLPLHRTGQIRVGNSLRVDWREVCPPATPVIEEWDLGGPTGRLALEQNGLGGTVEAETYICGNPPYMGGKKLNALQKEDMAIVFESDDSHRNLDYVCGFVMKMCRYLGTRDKGALVTTNSINQGTHVPSLWPKLFQLNVELEFAYEPFKWSNSAQNNAGVSCTILGFRKIDSAPKIIYERDAMRQVANISPYIVASPNIIVTPESSRQDDLSPMITGNAAYDGGNLFLSPQEARDLITRYPELAAKVRPVTGTSEFIDGVRRFCLWFEDDDLRFAQNHPATSGRIERVLAARQGGGEVAATLTRRPHQFRYRNRCMRHQVLIPQVSSERREYLPVGYLDDSYIISHLAHAIYDGSLIDFSILASKIHLVWISTVCGRLETRLRYASNIGWNAFPAPVLTAQDKADLTRCAEDILLAREAHFPATIADLYDPEAMPADLRRAHERNDETLERIYIGRRFRNDTERLEHLFALYAKMTVSGAVSAKKGASKPARKTRSPEKAA